VSLRDAGEHLAKLNVAILGISSDKPRTQKKFDENNTLGFPLLSDPDHKVAEQYGVWKQEDNFLKKLLGVTRSSFLIDETGKIMAVWYKISPLDTVPAALKVLES
jgi:thioredoxin-dependent peroxiredoxin